MSVIARYDPCGRCMQVVSMDLENGSKAPDWCPKCMDELSKQDGSKSNTKAGIFNLMIKNTSFDFGIGFKWTWILMFYIQIPFVKFQINLIKSKKIFRFIKI